MVSDFVHPPSVPFLVCSARNRSASAVGSHELLLGNKYGDDFQQLRLKRFTGPVGSVVAAFFILKAVLDGAQGHSPLSSIIAAIFMLSVSGTAQLMQSWNSGSEFATTDMLVSAWNFLAGSILPEAAGLAVVGAILNYVRHKPVAPLVGSALAFLSVRPFGNLCRRWWPDGKRTHQSDELAWNLLMPTLAGLFFAGAIWKFSKGTHYQHLSYAGFASLMCSGLLRLLESFAQQGAWNDPNRFWLSILALVNWIGNVILPLYGISQVVFDGAALCGLVRAGDGRRSLGWISLQPCAVSDCQEFFAWRNSGFRTEPQECASRRLQDGARRNTSNRNLQTRVTFMLLEFEDLLIVLGVGALMNVAGRFVTGQIAGLPAGVLMQYGVPLSIVPIRWHSSTASLGDTFGICCSGTRSLTNTAHLSVIAFSIVHT